MRFRHIFITMGSILTIVILLLSDPDGGVIRNIPFGTGTLSTLIILMSSIIYIALLHLARKGLLDYVDLEKYFKKALETPEGAGLAIIGIGLLLISISIVILAATK